MLMGGIVGSVTYEGRIGEYLPYIQSIYQKQDKITRLYKKVCGTRPIGEMSDSGITRLLSLNASLDNNLTK